MALEWEFRQTMCSALSATLWRRPPDPALIGGETRSVVTAVRHQDFLKPGGLKQAKPRAALLQSSSYRRKPVSRLLDVCHRSRWIPAFAGMTVRLKRTCSAFSATFLAPPRLEFASLRPNTDQGEHLSEPRKARRVTQPPFLDEHGGYRIRVANSAP